VLTFQDIQTDTAKLVNVGMVDLGQEPNFGRSHGIVVWQKELELEYAS
jgi:hypothetical protein